MQTRFIHAAFLILCAVLFHATTSVASAKGLPLGRLSLPPGFKISVYARDIPSVRSMTLGSDGTLYVGTWDKQVYAIPDANKDFKGDAVYPILDGLNTPIGVEFHDGSLYVAEVHRITRYDNISPQSRNPKPHVVYDKLADVKHHGQKYIRFGPDGLLYVPVGAPCNVCEPPGWQFAAILRMKADGTGAEKFASGIRNTVGFDWHPVTKELWFTDNGRDWLGDDKPPEELNCAPKPGMHFGFPYCHGGDILDPEFGKKRKCSEFTPPEFKIGAHHAALGIKFYTGKMFPPEYKNCAFICEHGSWNRTVRAGYQVSLVRFKDNKPVSYEKFIDGWNQPFGFWGRPVDLLVLPDGSLLISDDHAGAIYRVTWQGN